MDSETPTTVNIDYSNEESALAARIARRASRIELAPS
jgi:hypothetical protein